MRLVPLLVLIFAIALPLHADDADARRELEIKMAETRLHLLQEDPDIKQLHDAIQRLQKQLARQVDAHPAMVPLRAEADRLDAKASAN